MDDNLETVRNQLKISFPVMGQHNWLNLGVQNKPDEMGRGWWGKLSKEVR